MAADAAEADLHLIGHGYTTGRLHHGPQSGVEGLTTLIVLHQDIDRAG